MGERWEAGRDRGGSRLPLDNVGGIAYILSMKNAKRPDPSTADRIEYVTSDELRARGGWAAALWSRILDVQGWYSYTEQPSGTKVLLIAK
jgi:hypothetical protein